MSDTTKQISLFFNCTISLSSSSLLQGNNTV